MQEIEPGIFYENTYPGVTLGAILCSQGTVMIDAPLRAEDARTWVAILFNIGGNSNRFLVNLDAHADRTLGNRAMDTTIITNNISAQSFVGRPTIFKGQNAEDGSDWEIYDDVLGTRWVIPDITFSNRIFLNWDEIEIIFEHHPGPTLGSIWVLIPSAQVIFVGDAVLINQPPFLTNALIPDWIDGLDLLLKNYRDYTIISGRGGLVTVEDIRNQRRFLVKAKNALDRLAKRNADMHDHYKRRYQFGLSQYYLKHYLTSES
jgi:glyoxylase-like metal-dependent hydrolase (beta-lactamase superfamily II)